MSPSGVSIDSKVTAEDARKIARRRYLAMERVDMQSLAAELGIGRTTLYRWVGDRETLISDMLSEMVGEVLAASMAAAEGQGADRVMDGMRRFMETSAGYQPLRHLVRNEPELALRVMMAPNSGVSIAIRDCLQRELEAARPDWPDDQAAQLADVLTQLGMAYEWGNIATDCEPDIERAMRAMDMLLAAIG